jgi:hypothetical protein
MIWQREAKDILSPSVHELTGWENPFPAQLLEHGNGKKKGYLRENQ